MAREKIWFSDDEGPSINDNRQLELFSVAQDLKLEKKPIKMRYRTLIKDYQMYVRSKKANLKSEDVNILDQMLVLRFNNLINNVENDLRDGKLLSQSLGILESSLRRASDDFSRQYKKLLMSRDTLGYIPRINQDRVDDAYKLMIAELRKLVFAPVLNLFSWYPEDLPEDPVATEDQKQVLESDSVTPLKNLYNLVVGFLKNENLNAKVDIDQDEIKLRLVENP